MTEIQSVSDMISDHGAVRLVGRVIYVGLWSLIWRTNPDVFRSSSRIRSVSYKHVNTGAAAYVQNQFTKTHLWHWTRLFKDKIEMIPLNKNHIQTVKVIGDVFLGNSGRLRRVYFSLPSLIFDHYFRLITDVCMYVCCVAKARHINPCLEGKPAAIPERDGKCYSLRLPGPAVHPLVPEPYLLRGGLEGHLPRWPTGFPGFVSAWLLWLAGPFGLCVVFLWVRVQTLMWFCFTALTLFFFF